jgi:hypothetical protein
VRLLEWSGVCCLRSSSQVDECALRRQVVCISPGTPLSALLPKLCIAASEPKADPRRVSGPRVSTAACCAVSTNPIPILFPTEEVGHDGHVDVLVPPENSSDQSGRTSEEANEARRTPRTSLPTVPTAKGSGLNSGAWQQYEDATRRMRMRRGG